MAERTHSETTLTPAPVPCVPASITRVAVAVDGRLEGRDAAVLGSALAGAVGAETMLLSVEPDLPLIIPGLERKRTRLETEAMLKRTRESLSPSARLKITADLSLARGIKRLVARERCDLLTIGSSPDGEEGQVTIGRLTRQLFDQLDCGLAIATRGLSEETAFSLRRIGVGFDGEPEATAALLTAATIAAGGGAQLTIRGVLDDRIPKLGWPKLWMGGFEDAWQELMDDEAESLRRQAETATEELATDIAVEVHRGRAATSLLELSAEVDLLVIGSPRCGAMARLLLGATGEQLEHAARCSLLVVPRPRSQR